MHVNVILLLDIRVVNLILLWIHPTPHSAQSHGVETPLLIIFEMCLVEQTLGVPWYSLLYLVKPVEDSHPSLAIDDPLVANFELVEIGD